MERFELPMSSLGEAVDLVRCIHGAQPPGIDK